MNQASLSTVGLNISLGSAAAMLDAQDIAFFIHMPRVALAPNNSADSLVVKFPKGLAIWPVNEALPVHSGIREAPERVRLVVNEMPDAHDVVGLS